MTGLTDLPNEVIADILDLVSFTSYHSSVISSLRLVNRLFDYHIAPAIYRSVVLKFGDHPFFTPLQRMTILRPDNPHIRYIKRLSIRWTRPIQNMWDRQLNGVYEWPRHQDHSSKPFKANREDLKDELAMFFERLQPSQLIAFECTFHGIVDYSLLFRLQPGIRELVSAPCDLMQSMLETKSPILSRLPDLQTLEIFNLEQCFDDGDQTPFFVLEAVGSRLKHLNLHMESIFMRPTHFCLAPDWSRHPSSSDPHTSCLSRFHQLERMPIYMEKILEFKEHARKWLETRKFPKLESLTINGFRHGFPKHPNFSEAIPVHLLKSLSLRNCGAGLNETLVELCSKFSSLAHLQLHEAGSWQTAAHVLAKIPATLTSLHVVPTADSRLSRVPLPGILRHSSTLKSLWLGEGKPTPIYPYGGAMTSSAMLMDLLVDLQTVIGHMHLLKELALDFIAPGNVYLDLPWADLPRLKLLRLVARDERGSGSALAAPEAYPDIIWGIWKKRIGSVHGAKHYPRQLWVGLGKDIDHRSFLRGSGTAIELLSAKFLNSQLVSQEDDTTVAVTGVGYHVVNHVFPRSKILNWRGS